MNNQANPKSSTASPNYGFDTAADGTPAFELPADVIAYRRGDLAIVVNARARAVRVAVTGFAVDGARDLLSDATQRGDTLGLPPHGALVLTRRAR